MDKGNLELEQLIRHFEVYNRSEGKSPYTVKWYNEALNHFLRWLTSENKSTRLREIGEEQVRDFVLYLYEKKIRGKPLSKNTVANRVRSIRGFFSWLADEGYTDGHVLASLKPPRIVKTIVEPLTPQEIGKLFSNINQNTALGARNTAILALFLDTGLRLSEVANLKEYDVHLEQRYVKVLGKGSKERIVPLGIDCQKMLLNYCYYFRPAVAHQGVEELFLSLEGYPISHTAVRSFISRLAKSAGVPRLHAHLFRHTYATRFLLNGGDVFLLKQNLGHSTLAMVEHYRHIASREAALMSETFSPLDRMNLKELRRNRRNGGNHNERGTVYPNAGFSRGNNKKNGHSGNSKESGIFKKDSADLPPQRRHASSRERSRQKA